MSITLLKTEEELAAEVNARVAAISIANGYETDIGLKKFEGRRKIDDDIPPCSVVIAGEDTPKDAAGRTMTDVRNVLRFVLVGYHACDRDHPNVTARKMIRDFKRAIWRTNGEPNGNFGGKVRAVSYRGRDIGPRADGKAIVMAVVEFDVEFAEDLANP